MSLIVTGPVCRQAIDELEGSTNQSPLESLSIRLRLNLLIDSVIEAAEKAGRLIIETYLAPNRTFVDLPDLLNEIDPLRDFSEACRRELQ